MQRYTHGTGTAAGPKAGLLAALAAALLTGACSGGAADFDLSAGLGAKGPAVAEAKMPENAQSELDKAITHWGNEFEKNPRNAKAALAYAKNLKAANRKSEALAVMQQASIFHGNNREVASEYGRLALEAGQVSLAQKLLAVADDPTKPDWRVISARGTALAKQGAYAEAIPFFERAAAIAPSQASVQNNLAMAYAANGEPAKAETLLRQVADNGTDPVVRQNLALVMSLQGKYDEARTIAAVDLPADAARANVELVRSIVRLPEQKPPVPAAPARTLPAASPVIEAKAAPKAGPGLRPATTDAQVANVGGWDTRVAAGR